MKLLFLTSYYKPESAASNYLGDNIREALCDNDIIIELYTPMPSRGLSKEVREKYLDRILEYEYNGKLRIHRFPLISERKIR